MFSCQRSKYASPLACMACERARTCIDSTCNRSISPESLVRTSGEHRFDCAETAVRQSKARRIAWSACIAICRYSERPSCAGVFCWSDGLEAQAPAKIRAAAESDVSANVLNCRLKLFIRADVSQNREGGHLDAYSHVALLSEVFGFLSIPKSASSTSEAKLSIFAVNIVSA